MAHALDSKGASCCHLMPLLGLIGGSSHDQMPRLGSSVDYRSVLQMIRCTQDSSLHQTIIILEEII